MSEKKGKQPDKKEPDIMRTSFYPPPDWRNPEKEKECEERIRTILKVRGFKVDDDKVSP